MKTFIQMPKTPMKVLGIDPGIERLGWALVEEDGKKFKYILSGVKKTSKNLEVRERLLEINNFLEELILKERPTKLSVEKIFFSNNAKTAIIIGEVRGVILMLSAKHGLEFLELGPGEIKLSLTGYGKADKRGIENMLGHLVTLPEKKYLDDELICLFISFIKDHRQLDFFKKNQLHVICFDIDNIKF